jgi:Protein of unknown function (DUF664)
MTQLDEQGRPEPPLAADEAATLLGFLEFQRATLAWKCGGLDGARLRATVGVSRPLVADALADGGLERLARRSWPDGRSPSLRWILCHLVEEYSRHNGHADLIRESVDGLTGE